MKQNSHGEEKRAKFLFFSLIKREIQPKGGQKVEKCKEGTVY